MYLRHVVSTGKRQCGIFHSMDFSQANNHIRQCRSEIASGVGAEKYLHLFRWGEIRKVMVIFKVLGPKFFGGRLSLPTSPLDTGLPHVK